MITTEQKQTVMRLLEAAVDANIAQKNYYVFAGWRPHICAGAVDFMANECATPGRSVYTYVDADYGMNPAEVLALISSIASGALLPDSTEGLKDEA